MRGVCPRPGRPFLSISPGQGQSASRCASPHIARFAPGALRHDPASVLNDGQDGISSVVMLVQEERVALAVESPANSVGDRQQHLLVSTEDGGNLVEIDPEEQANSATQGGNPGPIGRDVVQQERGIREDLKPRGIPRATALSNRFGFHAQSVKRLDVLVKVREERCRDSRTAPAARSSISTLHEAGRFPRLGHRANEDSLETARMVVFTA